MFSPYAQSPLRGAPYSPTALVVYGDAGYLKMDKYVTDGIDREYKINRQKGTFKRHYGGDLAWAYEKELEKRKSSVRCKVEYVFHIVEDIFRWRKTRYKGIHKNDCHAHLLFASANLYMLAMGYVRPNAGNPGALKGLDEEKTEKKATLRLFSYLLLEITPLISGYLRG